MPSILVVDDEPSMRQFVKLVLQGEGYDVQTAEHGGTALEQIEVHPPDVVLLDLNMPVMDGWALHTELKRQERKIPVIFMTAGRSAKAEADAHGASGYLAKPFSVDDLLACVARFTDGHGDQAPDVTPHKSRVP